MAGSTFGTVFRLSTWGESHGPAVGCVVDGCPSGIPLTREEIQVELDRRRPGQSRITTQRREEDQVEILSGMFEGVTTGTPIGLLIRSTDQRSRDYSELKELYRPSHADYTWEAKFGVRDYRGGGRASYREAAARVAGGAVARALLAHRCGVEIVGYVLRVADLTGTVDPESVSREQVEANIVRCPDAAAAERMIARIEEARREGDQDQWVYAFQGATGDSVEVRLAGDAVWSKPFTSGPGDHENWVWIVLLDNGGIIP